MIPGHASTDPLLLCPCILAKYRKLVEIVTPIVGEVKVIETLRDRERQAYYVEHGVSRTMNSWHLPQKPKGLSLAFDLCPRVLLATKNWSPGHTLWRQIARVSRSLKMKVGADFLGFEKGWDWPHNEIHQCECSDT